MSITLWSRLRLRVTHTVTVEGLDLQVPVGVLDPVLFRSGAWFARQVAARVRRGERVLDLGCGTGVVGLLARQAGAVIVASDASARAVAAARHNGLADVRLGDLFAPLEDTPGPDEGLDHSAFDHSAFDYIAFNPPFLRSPPPVAARQPETQRGTQRATQPSARHSLALALCGGPELDTVRRFDAQLDRHLRPGGTALLCWSSLAPTQPDRLLSQQWTRSSTCIIQDEALSLWLRR